jgi:hypothetical protein
MPPRHSAAALAVLSLSGCIEEVALGSQCEEKTSCPRVVSRDGGVIIGSPITLLDGSARGGAGRPGQLDASTAVHDGAVGLATPIDPNAPPTFPGLQNGTFSVTRGDFGSVAYAPIDPVQLGITLVEPWSACGFGVSVLATAESMRGSGQEDVLPSEGDSFVEAQLGSVAFRGLRQTLSEPLEPGVRYAFRLDARAAVNGGVTLEIWGSLVDCVGGEKLTDLGRLPEDHWQSLCVSFVPLMPATELLLQPVLRGPASNGDTRVFFDNVRADPSCM